MVDTLAPQSRFTCKKNSILTMKIFFKRIAAADRTAGNFSEWRTQSVRKLRHSIDQGRMANGKQKVSKRLLAVGTDSRRVRFRARGALFILHRAAKFLTRFEGSLMPTICLQRRDHSTDYSWPYGFQGPGQHSTSFGKSCNQTQQRTSQYVEPARTTSTLVAIGQDVL